MLPLIFDLIYLLFLLLFLVDVIKLAVIFLQRKKIRPAKLDAFPFLSVIIPARNEEARIGNCLDGIAHQTYPKEFFEVIVLDDHSTDGTRHVVERFQLNNSNITLFSSEELLEGWGGKSFANHIGSQKAKAQLLLFMDADVELQPELLESAVCYFQKNRLDVLSLVARRILLSPAEKILLPPIFLMIAVFFNQRKVKLSGEFILFRREVYNTIGGHVAIKSTVSDDLDFALLLEKTNFKTGFPYAEKLAATRMYSGFKALYAGVSKMFQRLLSENIFIAAWRSKKYFLFVVISAAALVLYAKNYSFRFFNKNVLLIFPSAITLLFIGATFYFRIFFLYGILMPLGWLLQLVLFVRSLRGRFRRYHEWSGRKVFTR